MSYLYARTSRCFSSCRRVISLLFDDDSLVADVIVDAGRRLLHALHPSRSSDQPLAGLPISRTTRDKRPRYPSFQLGGRTKEARRTSRVSRSRRPRRQRRRHFRLSAAIVRRSGSPAGSAARGNFGVGPTRPGITPGKWRQRHLLRNARRLLMMRILIYKEPCMHDRPEQSV